MYFSFFLYGHSFGKGLHKYNFYIHGIYSTGYPDLYNVFLFKYYLEDKITFDNDRKEYFIRWKYTIYDLYKCGKCKIYSSFYVIFFHGV